MIKEHMLTWLQEGNVSIPSFLFVHYAEMGLDEQELILLMQLKHFQTEGNSFPTPNEISERMTFSPIECMNVLRKLVQKGFLEIKEEPTTDDAMLSETYSLLPLQEKIVEYFLLKQKRQNVKNAQEEEKSLYTIFEQEFGRPLSPFECETLGMWIDNDNHSSAVIKAALREAVISGKLNFRYIDRILFEWKKNGVKTVEQAKSYSEKFRASQRREKPSEPKAQQVSIYNWLEN